MKTRIAEKFPEKKRLIIESASRLFSRRGYNETAMKDISNDAGIAVGTIYLYYKNKEDLLSGIFQYSSAMLLNRIEERMTDRNDPQERFLTYFDESIEFSLRHPELFLIIFIDFRRKEIELPQRLVYSSFRKYIAIGEMILEEGKNSGIFRYAATSASLILGITSMWAGLVLRKILDPRFHDITKGQREISSLIRSIVLEGILTRPTAALSDPGTKSRTAHHHKETK